ncbi:GrBNV gp09-like protein [Tomelloso virus]|uniref:GrBNV gp09-like protein n=1 Tax=Tomelloso virus TaxID=2053981 RepID=A0A2H4T2R0_9VIRU|nr:GrBNV gp09-like protein [Tomelloso virus]ATY70214.1 GrBNV gp09-like protein [Tomelloso virus]
MDSSAKPFVQQFGGSYLANFGLEEPTTTTQATPTRRKRKAQSESEADTESEPKYIQDVSSARILPIASGKKKRDTEVLNPTTLECLPVGKEYRIGNGIFISKSSLYKIEFDDYTLITDAPFKIENAPKELKPLLRKRWIYKLHVNSTLAPIIKRSVLLDRVIGGQILAYRYTECSVAGNSCVYYGFVPTIAKTFQDSHSTCYVAAKELWPRRLFIYLKVGYSCNCGEKNCTTWNGDTVNYPTREAFCAKKIKWDRLYIMMGDSDKSCLEIIRPFRSCEVCAQCFACSNSMDFCRKHKKCTHKTAKPLADIAAIMPSNMKMCAKYRV